MVVLMKVEVYLLLDGVVGCGAKIGFFLLTCT